jgi:ribonuclease HI
MYFPWKTHLSSLANVHVELGPKKKSKEYSKEIIKTIEERSDLDHIIAFTDGSLLPPNITYMHKIVDKTKRTKQSVVAPMRVLPQNRHLYHPDTLFPDESMNQKRTRTGAAFTVGHMNNMVAEQKAALGPKASIFNAEIYAILMFLEWLETAMRSDTFKAEHPTKYISIFSDCKGAIQTITGPTPKTGREWYYKIKNIVKNLLKEHDVDLSFTWAPGHMKIPGNKRADTLAKQATNQPPIITSTTTARKQLAKHICISTWIDHYRGVENEKSRWITKHKSTNPSVFLKDVNVPRNIASRYIQTITGHGHNADYYQRFLRPHIVEGKINNICKRCKIPNTISHILNDCLTFSWSRQKLKKVIKTGKITIKKIVGTEKGKKAFFSFLQSCGVFTNDGKTHIEFSKKTTPRRGLPQALIAPKRPKKPPDRMDEGSGEYITRLLS